MARLSIREYEHTTHLARGLIPVGEEPALASQSVAIGGASAQSATLNLRTKFVRIHSDVACSIEFGTDPTAVAGSCDFAAGQTEYFGVANASQIKIAVIAT